ncbi:MAG: hypothetical protein EZS28_035793, partial [Streblomastix strix]
MNYSGPPGRAPDQSNTKLRSRQPTSRRQWIVPPTQTNPQSQITPNSNQNQSSILNVDLMGIFTNPFSVPQGIQHQQNAGEAAQVQHAPRDTFSTNGNVRKVASSTDGIVSGQVGVAGTKPINIYRQHLLHNSMEIPFVNPKLRRKEERHLSEVKPQGQILLLSQTRTRSKTSSADSQMQASGRFQLMGIQNRTKEEIHTLEIFPRIQMEETLQLQPDTGMGGKPILYLEAWNL